MVILDGGSSPAIEEALAGDVRRAIALDQYRAAVAARLRWWRRWEQDQQAFQEFHFLTTGRRDVHRLLAAILERESYWKQELG